MINHDLGYVGSIDRFAVDRWRARRRPRLNDQGYLVFIVTNQAGVARGYYTEDDVGRLHAHIELRCACGGAHIDDIRYCPYHIDAQGRALSQRPSMAQAQPGMLLDLISRLAARSGGVPPDRRPGERSGGGTGRRRQRAPFHRWQSPRFRAPPRSWLSPAIGTAAPKFTPVQRVVGLCFPASKSGRRSAVMRWASA